MSETVEMFNIKEGVIKRISADDAVFEMYYLRYRIPTHNELKKSGSKTDIEDIKRIISANERYIPLYDAFTFNIYIVQKRNVYVRVVNHDYRFPDDLILKTIMSTRDKKLVMVHTKPELENDKVFMRSIRKADLMLEFMSQFNKDILYKTYLDVFYRYAPMIGNATYTCIRKSFIPHKSHLKPYYTKDEVVKLAMNMELIKLPPKMSYIDFKDTLTHDDYQKICTAVQQNDISANILTQHQNYIVETDLVGLIQYYTIQGSYFMNQYLRGMTKYEYKNEYLEENIKRMWELVLNSPAFDNDYTFYRFVSADNYLKHLNIGDVFMDAGFTSTTRDPFYRNDLYKFGFILIKIKIPKGVRGVGLCLETLSHFPFEEEVILPPRAKLKLISKDDDCEYFHPDESFVSNIETRYEFEWIGNDKIEMPDRPPLPSDLETKTIDFLNLDKTRTVSVREKIDYTMKKYFDPMNRIRCKIGDNTFYVVGEWYDSIGPYEEMYSIKTSEGFSMYSIYKGYILFMIEIGEVDGYSQIKVNYYTKYSRLDRRNIMGDDNFIKFISSIAHYFDIPNVTIYADYMSCDKSVRGEGSDIAKTLSRQMIDVTTKYSDDLQTQNILQIQSAGANIYEGIIDNIPKGLIQKKQRAYINIQDKHHEEPRKKKNFNNTKGDVKGTMKKERRTKNVKIIESDFDESFKGGSYCLDFYRYLKYDEKRYFNTSTLTAELQPKFSYYDLDLLKIVKPTTILRKEDRDEIYQIYVKNYLLETQEEQDTLANFYIWMIDNKCYLMDILVQKMDRLYKTDKTDNPFKKGMYVLDAMAYLYNRRYVNTYSRYIKMIIDEEHQLLTLPKNDYRIRR